MKKSIIIKEEEKGKGVYLIDVDTKKSGEVKGKDSWERISNTIREFLNTGKNDKPALHA